MEPEATSRVLHTHTPRSTEVDIDVAITTTGATLAVKVGVAAKPGEADEETAMRALVLSLTASAATIKAYEERGITFGKAEGRR